MNKDLKTYNQKRNFNKTTEPKGKKEISKKKLRFVVQHHLATKDHFDLRLEWAGTLKSWAVPKGPSYNRKDKRLAIMVEAHPISYRNFEGTIPKGEYGGGTVMLFDEGYYEPTENLNEGIKKGIIKFSLMGKRLKGSWALIHFKEDNWLLIKEDDNVKGFKDIKNIKTSIRTGRTMDEIALGSKKKRNDKDTVEGINISNPNKIIYSKPKITKMKIIKYYQAVAPKMLPYLENRIISSVRCPDGVDGDSFYKKHLEDNREGLCKKILKNKEGEKEEYFYIDSIEGLINEAQMNTIEFHIWGSNADDINHPNMMIFDLDPDEKLSLKKLRDGVKDLKSILDDFKLISYLKTSGGKGYHVVVPINGVAWKEFREIAKNIAKLMEAKWPNKYTSNIRKDKRNNKIFIDWVRNTKGATSVAPYSLRAREGASVSMPISWKELDKIRPNEITLEKALKRIKKSDPWKNYFN